MTLKECYYIHVGASGDSERTFEKNRITKSDLFDIVEDNQLIPIPEKNCLSLEELRHTLLDYEDEQKISVWGDSKTGSIKKGSLIILVSHNQMEYIGEVVFKISCEALSQKLWIGKWTYQIGVKNVIKVNIPNEHLKIDENTQGFYHILGIDNKANVQSSNKSKIGVDAVLNRLNEYCINDRYKCVKKYID